MNQTGRAYRFEGATTTGNSYTNDEAVGGESNISVRIDHVSSASNNSKVCHYLREGLVIARFQEPSRPFKPASLMDIISTQYVEHESYVADDIFNLLF